MGQHDALGDEVDHEDQQRDQPGSQRRIRGPLPLPSPCTRCRGGRGARLQPLHGDLAVAGLALAVGAVLDAREGLLDVIEVASLGVAVWMVASYWYSSVPWSASGWSGRGWRRVLAVAGPDDLLVLGHGLTTRSFSASNSFRNRCSSVLRMRRPLSPRVRPWRAAMVTSTSPILNESRCGSSPSSASDSARVSWRMRSACVGHGRLHVFGPGDHQGDAVAHLQAALLAQVLDLVDDLARQALGAQRVVDGGVQRHRQRALAGGREGRDALLLHLDLLEAEHLGAAVDGDRSTVPSRAGHDLIGVEGLDGLRPGGDCLPKRGPQGAEVGPGRQRATARGSSTAATSLTFSSPPRSREGGVGEQGAGAVVGAVHQQTAQRLARLDLGLLAQAAAEAHHVLGGGHAGLELRVAGRVGRREVLQVDRDARVAVAACRPRYSSSAVNGTKGASSLSTVSSTVCRVV